MQNLAQKGLLWERRLKNLVNLRSNGLVFLKYLGAVMESNFITEHEIMENNLKMVGEMGK